MLGELEDDPHHFRVRLWHDGRVVVRVDGEGVRIPWTTCGEAAGPLRSLVGMKLSPSSTAVAGAGNPRANCTHMFDLAGLVVAHAASGRGTRQYDCAIPEPVEGPTVATLDRDGERLLTWDVGPRGIDGPPPFDEAPLMGGFLSWAESHLSADLAEAAIVLRRACLISRSRLFQLDSFSVAANMQHASTQPGSGRCYTFSPSVLERAHRTSGTQRDFTSEPDALLSDSPELPEDPI